MTDPNLVTTCNFSGRDYFIKMNTSNKILELLVTDKQSGEDWQCSYEASYIESVTKKTGNFKQFDIFTAMLKSGLLKTSNCVSLDLLTFEDLDSLRNHRIRGPSSTYRISQTNKNRRYLILTYTVEFDRIHYPLPLEYCGRPDPEILQQHILRLEDEIVQLNEQLQRRGTNKNETRIIISLQKQIEDLSEENQDLHEEIKRLTRLLEKRPQNSRNRVNLLQNAIKDLEKNVLSQKRSHHQIVEKLLNDKISLSRELDRIKSCENILRDKLRAVSNTRSRERVMKKVSNPGPSGDSRSPSPLYRTENWESQSPLRNSRATRPRTKLRAKSRSDSESSDKQGNVLTKPNSSKAGNKTKLAEPTSSRSNSASSRSSSTSSKRGAHSRTIQKYSSAPCNSLRLSKSFPSPKRTQSTSSNLDFTNLESRIHTLKTLLHTNLPFK